MINEVMLIGYVGADPESRQFETGSEVARLRVATSESYKDRDGEWQDKTEWHTVVAWNKLSEKVMQSVHKGNLVYVKGKLTHREWEDDDGNKRYSTEVVASYIRNLIRTDSNNDSREEEAPSRQRNSGGNQRRGTAGNSRRSEESGRSGRSGRNEGSAAYEGANTGKDDDLPF